ncbi:hypothetical protein TNCV_57681 [Trichonephila clavipes]|nr:hypothetical protein TNCV_57681 [Trichonephila clavipes]
MPVVSLDLEHYAGDRTILLGSAPILREHPGGGEEPSPSTNLTRELAARRLFRVPPCRESNIHLQASMPSPGFEPRSYVPQAASLTTIPDGRLKHFFK